MAKNANKDMDKDETIDMSKNISKYLLATIGLAGLLFAGMIAPNLFLAMKPFLPRKNYTKKQISNVIYRAKRNRLISVAYKGDKTVIKLTKEGKEKLLIYKFEDLRLIKPKKWDRKWRLVIFDIPEEYKQARNAFSQKLKEMEFYQLQKSVWITPCPCEDEVDFIKETFEIRRHVRVVTAETIDIQDDLISFFKLKK